MKFSLFGSLPNLISLGRLLLVPAIIALIAAQRWREAFVCFIIAGASDALDGWLAKTFDLRTQLGAYLDPIADKALLVSIYVALAIVGAIPATIAIIVVARDFMIVGAFMVSWFLDRPLEVRPLVISKINTLAQILFAALVLSVEAFGLGKGAWFQFSLYAVAGLALASLGAYFSQWFRHMSA
jgi:cardiolipin synthase (CMP-forming)